MAVDRHAEGPAHQFGPHQFAQRGALGLHRAPSGPRYHGMAAPMRWPPIRKGTRSSGLDRRIAHQVDAIRIRARAQPQSARVDQRHEHRGAPSPTGGAACRPTAVASPGCADRRWSLRRRCAPGRARRRRIPPPARPTGAAQHEGLDREALSVRLDLALPGAASCAGRPARRAGAARSIREVRSWSLGRGGGGGSQDGGGAAIKASHARATVSDHATKSFQFRQPAPSRGIGSALLWGAIEFVALARSR